VTLGGNTRAEAIAEYDRGLVAYQFPMKHMQLLLRRPEEREAALESRIDELNDFDSPNFHKWLTASELGQSFGVDASDIAKIEKWLIAHSFHISGVLPSRMVIEFSGTAGEAAEAFHTSIHRLRVNGVNHFANMQDPEIPAALAPAVTGIVSLHNFRPHLTIVPKTAYTFGTSQCWPLTNGHAGPCYTLVPADLATIYNFKPAFSSGLSGAGETVVVSDLPDISLFAGNGIWSHYYIYCDSDGGLCSGAASNWGAAGGTSFSTPILPGVQALIVQKTGQSWGNSAPVFYKLAKAEYGRSGDKKCNATKGNKIAADCVFNDVEECDNNIDCTGEYDCYLPSGEYGVLSTSDTKYKIAYAARKGWDFPTGVGTPNVTNLLNAWPSGVSRQR
jgi:subtilase family serine protease